MQAEAQTAHVSGGIARPVEDRSSVRPRWSAILALLWSAATSVLPAVALFVFLRTFVVHAFLVPSASMNPTLEVGDYILADPTVFGARLPLLGARAPALRDPGRGEVVVFRPGYNEPVVDVVKRVVGLPGDTVQMASRTLRVNGRPVAEPYAATSGTADEPLKLEGALGQGWHLDALPASASRAAYRPSRDSWGPLVVPAGQYFLLGDNRDRSSDSRHLGFIPRGEITGKVRFVYFSRRIVPTRGITGWLGTVRWNRVGKVR